MAKAKAAPAKTVLTRMGEPVERIAFEIDAALVKRVLAFRGKVMQRGINFRVRDTYEVLLALALEHEPEAIKRAIARAGAPS